MIEYEFIPTDGDESLQRLRVPGGWLVKATIASDKLGAQCNDYGSFGGGKVYSVALTFVPDPNHEWSI